LRFTRIYVLIRERHISMNRTIPQVQRPFARSDRDDRTVAKAITSATTPATESDSATQPAAVGPVVSDLVGATELLPCIENQHGSYLGIGAAADCG
jgi:hypothetical protein